MGLTMGVDSVRFWPIGISNRIESGDRVGLGPFMRFHFSLFLSILSPVLRYTIQSLQVCFLSVSITLRLFDKK